MIKTLRKWVRFKIKEIIYRLRGDYTTEQLVKMGLVVGSNFKRMIGTILDPSHCWLITIGDDVTLAPRVHILAHDASTCYFVGYAKIGRVIIGNNVFIGADTIVLPNVRIGNNVVIGANSTVTKNVPDNVVYAGSPAQFICSIDQYIKKNALLMTTRPVYSDDYTLRKRINKTQKDQQRNDLSDGIGFVK